MNTYRFDVVIIGAGPAGVAAAGALAGSGISVCLLEAGVYAGAENWSGCVYFTESLAQEDCFGHKAVASAPFERRVVRRGTLVHNGLDEVGLTLSDTGVFRDCYTVLRPIYDPYFAELARLKGAALIAKTTVTSLIRKNGRVVGVQTSRGPLYADVVFIAEGDASHLVRSERLERVPEPHYLQGVKAVLSLPGDEIEKRFGLDQGEGAAFEVLVRNASIAGRTAKLNVGGFLYTNRDSLSLGYVLPLDNLKKNYRGDHDRLFEWLKGLPAISDLTKDATLSAYGTKIIRSGGWRERPILVEDGLAVGGASTGLGIDVPFPNFTGPAAATGLYFARAVKGLLKDGRDLTAKNLARAYLAPLKESVYGRNARYLSAWPGYFGRSSVLFGRTTDMLCGSAHFLSSGSLIETGRFLRSHVLSFRALKESITDTLSAVSALRLWKPLFLTLLNPATVAAWIGNHFKTAAAPDKRLALVLNLGGKKIDAATLPWPVGGLLRRLSPDLSKALAAVYANTDELVEHRFSNAVRLVLRSFRLTDILVLPAFGCLLFLIALGTAIGDAFRFYILKVSVDKLLAEPVMAYTDAQRKARDLDAVKPSVSLEAKLATNTYHVGSASHIRALWPASIAGQPDMSQAALWWVCPARVYGYDGPLMGRGKVSVNWENCIKCESCWRSEPGRALWGRFTDHGLIYRPESGVMAHLLGSLKQSASTQAPAKPAHVVDQKLWYVSGTISGAVAAVMNASAAFRDSIDHLPPSPDAGRCSWPHALGTRLLEKMTKLEDLLRADERPDAAGEIAEEKALIRICRGGPAWPPESGQPHRVAPTEFRTSTANRLFHCRYTVARLEDLLHSWTVDPLPPRSEGSSPSGAQGTGISYNDLSRLFPDRVVKQWEENPMPREWAEKLGQFIGQHRRAALPVIRLLSSVSPALGLIAARQIAAMNILDHAGRPAVSGICACSGENVIVADSSKGLKLAGTLHFVPIAASTSLLVITAGKGVVVPFTAPGVTITPMPAIGFRAAALSRADLDCTVNKQDVFPVRDSGEIDHASYLAIALGAGDYLSRRAKEHAASRVQFPGQMLDTEGRDGIAKLGAVKALVARVEAWRLLLETLYDVHSALRTPHSALVNGSHSELRTPNSALDSLCSSLAALAFGPENGCMAYDAGQVFGGFAFSEDDLLSRSYRDSSLFRFLSPGYRAAEALHAGLSGKDLGEILIHELGSLSGISGSPLGMLVKQWNEARTAYERIPAGSDAQLAGDAAALLLGIRALLAVVEQRLDAGASMEQEAACVEVLLGIAEKAIMKAALSAGSGAVSPAALFPASPDVAAIALEQDYEGFCARKGRHHRSGTFLVSIFDRSPRYVPEMQLHDPILRKLWSELVDWFQANGSGKPYEGMHFERYVEQLHNLPAEFLAAVKQKKWLATTIPASEDGLGWRKAGYYVLNSVAGSFGDAAVCLLIMANTSIGTTPVLLGLEDELPRVREELTPLVLDPKRLGEISGRLKRLVVSFKSPNPGWIKKEYTAIMKLVDDRIRRTRVVKYLSANFLRAFYGAGIAGKRGDFGAFTTGLVHAASLFERIMPEVRAALEELPRRERAHKHFLRNLGHGGVSAFALTEPTAGSDSGGVKTMAVLKTAMLAALPDGRYVYSPTGELDKCKRYLIDADRIEFSRDGMAYRTPDDTLALIRYDRYDYAADEGVRFYERQGAVCEFHDIGQVRPTATGPMYEYYSLTGAKMWITNGSLASQFCLYAQSPEGVTGFMVDRHAEGLKVGADEHKTGQRGSPTNEISLDNVRVPREAVIGYEGHGQVNALETLNVGRCGLSVVAGAIARKLMAEASLAVPQTELRDRLLGEAAAVQFGSESLAYYLIGLFDRPHESVRMESAIAKYVCSEDVHEIISLIERAYGPPGQTEQFLLEKARRDARILNIYEGTNEVQRFLILKDLISQAEDWPLLPERIPERPEDNAAMTLGHWKNRLRQRVLAARERLGDAAWSDAMLQPALFPLAEMAGEVLRLECVIYRLEWLTARRELLGPSYVEPLRAAGKRATQRAIAQLEHLDRSFTKAWSWISRDLDGPEVRACDAALDRAAEQIAAHDEHVVAVKAPLRILSVVRPVSDLSPAPRLIEGTISELVWEADPLDRSAMDQVLNLKTASGPNVIVDVLMPGGAEREQLLRTVAPTADRLIRLDTNDLNGTLLAATVRELEVDGKYDLIVMGAGSLDGGHGIAAFLAGAMTRPYLSVPRITTKSDRSEVEDVAVPSVIGITHSSEAIEHGISDLVAAFSRSVVVMKPSEGVPASAPRFSRPVAAPTAMKTITTVKDAAVFLRDNAAAASAARTDVYTGAIGKGRLAAGPVVWSILDHSGGKDGLAALRACRIAADLFGKNACVLIAAPRDRWPSLLGLARANGLDKAFCLDTKGGALSSTGRLQVLRLIIEGTDSPVIVAGAAWNDALGTAAGSYAGKDPVQLTSGITHLKRNADGYLAVSMAAYGGKLVRQERIADGSAFLTMSGDAELPAQTVHESFTAVALDIEMKPDWTAPIPPPVEPTLSNADVIIDIGYGVRDAKGMELARELKKKLEGMGLGPMFGATRKVTQDLKLLPLEAQIGQTGVAVNPKIIICLGISGAPQHIDYLGARAEVLCFNKDPEAPLMKLNQGRQSPRVHPIEGDLFVTVRELIETLE